ncbi:MAG: hypothetical protein A3F17_08455 [Gammaproteobacteria bacterium RIFCSPHIGHO2_12_FULL_41_15]|nr:MAG: hypothetical protein A3F17_08455 [Gammaproteobacteria bacterium RIFCSPHIGHO2_12_FULL_41_15]
MEELQQTKLQRFIARSLYIFLTPLGLSVLWFYYRIHVHGRHNIPKSADRGYLIVSNHTLHLDPLVIAYTMFPKRIHHSTIVRNMNLPFVGSFIRLMGGFAIPMKNGWQQMGEPITERVNQGWIVHFFPEGKLKKFNQQIQRFRHGAFHLAIESNIPVLPITTVVRRRKWFGRKVHWLPPKVDVYVGELCSPEPYQTITPMYRRATCMANEVKNNMQDVIVAKGYQVN